MDAQEIDNKLKDRWILFDDTDKNFIRQNYSLALDPRPYYQTFNVCTTMICDEQIVLIVKSGTAKYTINYEKHNMKAGDLLIMPAGTIFSIDQMSSYHPCGLSFTNEFIGMDNLSTPMIRGLFDDVLHISLGNEDASMILSFYLKMKSLLDNTTNNDLTDFKTALMSLLLMVSAIKQNNEHNDANKKPLSRSAEVFAAFMKLLRGLDMPARTVKYYADELKVTENYLSTAVKEHSGRTVMQFVNEKTETCIKILLVQTEDTLDEIAAKTKLGNTSSLIRFFKKETGETPAEYRSRMKSKVVEQ